MGNRQQNIVIIGGAGLIGQHLVRGLIAGGYNPVVLTRNPSKAKDLFGVDVNVEYWDGTDTASLATILNGSKAVVNLAGESIATRWTKKKQKSILKSRINSTNALVDAIKSCFEPPEVFVQASAIGYYPYNSNEQVDERGPVGNGFLSQVVMRWEQEAVKVEDKSRLVIIRTGIVLSAEGGFLSKIVLPIKFFSGGWFGNGSQIISWVHINDHVRAIQYLIEVDFTKGIYNLVSPEPITYKNFVKKIGVVLNRPVWMSIPSFIIKLIFGTMANEVVLSNQKVIPTRLQNAGFQFKYSNVTIALENLLEKKENYH